MCSGPSPQPVARRSSPRSVSSSGRAGAGRMKRTIIDIARGTDMTFDGRMPHVAVERSEQIAPRVV
eukprot:1866473-Alexandrium_andersonii.AAC.1